MPFVGSYSVGQHWYGINKRVGQTIKKAHPNFPSDLSRSGANDNCSHLEITGPFSRGFPPAQLSP